MYKNSKKCIDDIDFCQIENEIWRMLLRRN
jgi:hypothetical protein